MPKVFFFNILIITIFIFNQNIMFAGPPFLTDDPEPVEFKHLEFYVASTQQFASHRIDATLPHLEINYGIMPDVQIHLLTPINFTQLDGINTYKYSNTELGVKYRFINETDDIPQIGLFPLAEIPTEINRNQNGDNNFQLYLPIWIQKSWGKLTTYGGSGFWYNPGKENKNWIFSGWEIQYEFSDLLTLGNEFYFHTPDSQNSENLWGFNLGGYINFDNNNHLLFSIGRSISGENIITGYIGYQLTI